MGMVVRTNTMALNAYRQLGMNNSAVAKSLEKLSSGFRINRAGDDAAGLAISEKMKAQIKGLETASANAQDGISLIQTAEGNLNEVHDMLNRMVELATKSANGTYTSTERNALQDEVNALLDEIDRISQSANFNGTNLLDGSLGLNSDAFAITGVPAEKAQTGAVTGGDLVVTTTGYHYEKQGTSSVNPSAAIDLTGLSVDGVTAGDSVKFTVNLGSNAVTVTLTGKTSYAAADIATSLAAALKTDATLKVKVADGTSAGGEDGIKLGNAAYTVAASGDTVTLTFGGWLEEGSAWTAAATKYHPTTGTAAGKPKDFGEDDAKAMNQTLGFTVSVDKSSFTNATTAGDGEIKGDLIHATTQVDQAVAKTDASFAGADIKLTADLMTEGSTLTIDGTTFTFHTEKKADGTAYNGAGDIDLSDIVKKDGESDDDFNARLIHKAVDQLSKKTIAASADNEQRTWKISSKGADTIHIDQTAATNTADKALKTMADIQKLVSGVAASKVAGAKNIGTKISVKDGAKIEEGDGLTIKDVQYVFTKKTQVPDDTDKVKYVSIDSTGSNAAAQLAAKLGETAEADGSIILRAANATDTVAPKVMGKGLTLQIGDTAAQFNKMNVLVADMGTKALGLGNLKITSETLASDAIDKIKTAINTVSTTRAGLGALQNRLEHTINNLDVAAENLSAANSRIRDTDMAKEMMNYTKMNVLVQSAQAMLAQANQQPQSVLQLLQ